MGIKKPEILVEPPFLRIKLASWLSSCFPHAFLMLYLCISADSIHVSDTSRHTRDKAAACQTCTTILPTTILLHTHTHTLLLFYHTHTPARQPGACLTCTNTHTHTNYATTISRLLQALIHAFTAAILRHTQHT